MSSASQLYVRKLLKAYATLNAYCQIYPLPVSPLPATNTHVRHFATVKLKEQSTVEKCYALLEVDSNCSEDELRSAYLEKVKLYHPDTSNNSRDANMFARIQDAYKTAMNHKRGQVVVEEKEIVKEEDDDGAGHTIPQHRRYLSFDGVGFGTPSKRERQYKQVRVSQATESVFEHRKRKHGTGESTLMTKDMAQARKIKISSFIDRVVDDMIRESMQKGDFDNLSGSGKPLEKSDYNPYIDPTTHNINKILVNNGFKPEWIMLSKEIRVNIGYAKEKLSILREQMGPPPYFNENELRWKFGIDKFRDQVKEINFKINKYNFIVPFMERQMVHYNAEQCVEDVLENHVAYLPRDASGNVLTLTEMDTAKDKNEDRINWTEVWSNIKDIFKYR
ncbi:dnaJ homolog subfamily C member 28-like [Physella acuta]|uniref:dnaJ homolog subfamily C member 28-like n=1 Tax=Physella acuta TaxID=109671 RepID=UPI0027DC7BE8|nr:dnaJ homolog subfamily C member 28-like [Physella acuta]